MRRPERKIKEKVTLLSLLERSQVGRMATVNRRGFPVIKPVNFLYSDGRLYIHSSQKGEKIADIRKGSPICFELDEPIAYAPAPGPACLAGYYYRSVIIKGKAALINDERKKLRILEELMEKYQPEGGYAPISEEVMRRTALIEISIGRMTGKERLG